MQDACIQMTVIKPPSSFSHERTETIQQLMKLFAVSILTAASCHSFFVVHVIHFDSM